MWSSLHSTARPASPAASLVQVPRNCIVARSWLLTAQGAVLAARGLSRRAGRGKALDVKKTSLADAQAHLPELVDAAERRRRRTVILRNGKPVAAIVPIGSDAARPLQAEEITRLFGALGKSAADRSAVAELISDRR